MEHVIIKKSNISKKGMFANQNFKKGEIILKWKPIEITKAEYKNLPREDKNYIIVENNKYYLMQSPEKYVNHSCDPNTVAINNCDIALREIKAGEEITSDYSKSKSPESFRCNCGSEKCRKFIKPPY